MKIVDAKPSQWTKKRDSTKNNNSYQKTKDIDERAKVKNKIDKDNQNSELYLCFKQGNP